MSKHIATLKSGSRVNQGNRKWYHSTDCVLFLLVFYSNFLRCSTCKYTVTLKPRLGPLKVIGTDTDRSATYDFLLTFHSGLSVSEINGDFIRKLQIFPTHPVYFVPPLKGFPWELGISARGQKNLSHGSSIPGRERRLTTSSAVWIQYTNVTARQTDRRRDRQTPGDSNHAYA